jgi:hypothetical protein
MTGIDRNFVREWLAEQADDLRLSAIASIAIGPSLFT